MGRKRSESREGRGPEREGRRAVSGGERAQLMMKQRRVGVRVHYAFSSLTWRDVRVHEGWGEEAEVGRKVTANRHTHK